MITFFIRIFVLFKIATLTRLESPDKLKYSLPFLFKRKIFNYNFKPLVARTVDETFLNLLLYLEAIKLYSAMH